MPTCIYLVEDHGLMRHMIVEQVRRRWPQLKCLMYSGHGEAPYVERALAVGAHGFVLKGAPDELTGAIRHVMRGELYVSRALSL